MIKIYQAELAFLLEVLKIGLFLKVKTAACWSDQEVSILNNVLVTSHPMKTLCLCQELWSGLVWQSFPVVIWACNQPELNIRYLEKFKSSKILVQSFKHIFYYSARHLFKILANAMWEAQKEIPASVSGNKGPF